VILPKALRESYGIEEGDALIVENGECIALRPEKKRNLSGFETALNTHAEKLKRLGINGPKPGELANDYLEMEFEE